MQEGEIYRKLARHLDRLPGGYPPSESGVELRILKRLFTPEEAHLAMHLTLIHEDARVIAYRAGIPAAEAAERLETMLYKGLVYAQQAAGKPPRYMIAQFAIGFYEAQVNRLDKELAEDVEEYLLTLFKPETWGKAPQLRTIPVGESIPITSDVMPYERAEQVVAVNRVIAVANCICRQQQRLLGQGCDKPLETCLVFGSAAEHYIETGRGREITQDDAMGILKTAEHAGLVLQPANDQNPMNICACCGCCCGILANLKKHPEPASLVSSSYRAVLDQDTCAACGECIERCQMDALKLEGGTMWLNQARCIGCGLCVTICPTGSLTLERKPEGELTPVPRNITQSFIRNARALGKFGYRDLLLTGLRSMLDRLRAPR